MAEFVGYEFLRDRWRLPVFPITRPARVMPVTRVTAQADMLLVPAGVAPNTNNPLDHVLFALKHEGTNLQVLAEIMPHITAEDIGRAAWAKPNSGYLRVAAYLWEHFTGMRLADAPSITASATSVFDAERYLVSVDPQKDARWRVAFNGLGDLDYCVTVQRTEAIQSLLDEDILQQTRLFFEQTEKPVMDRAITWAYLSETEGSFAIERETVPENKAEAFACLLRKAFDPEVCNEAYLSHLQNAVITNPLDRAACYRGVQNWLHNGLRGASGIAYLPPPPELLEDIMPHIADMADTLHKKVDPVVAAAIVSFAFVYAHPFMDGNGRLSRFLFHRTLAQSGRMETPTTGKMLLPVSVAMKRHESEYLRVLQSFSTPARNLWDVRWIDQEQFDFKMNGSGAPYRYWDATDVARFSLQMAKEALREDLQAEVNTLVRYDAIYRKVDAAYDVRNSELSLLIRSCLQNAGAVSKNRRRQFAATVPEPVFDAIEQAWADTAMLLAMDTGLHPGPADGEARALRMERNFHDGLLPPPSADDPAVGGGGTFTGTVRALVKDANMNAFALVENDQGAFSVPVSDADREKLTVGDVATFEVVSGTQHCTLMMPTKPEPVTASNLGLKTSGAEPE